MQAGRRRPRAHLPGGHRPASSHPSPPAAESPACSLATTSDPPGRFHLAEVNIAFLKEPLTSPRIADFVAQLEPINRLADESPGLAWRLQTDAGEVAPIRAFDDDLVLVNLSVWASLESLQGFVCRSRYMEVTGHRRGWFEWLGEASVAP